MRTSELGPIPADFVILDRYQDVLPQISGEFMILDRYQNYVSSG